jgi:exonuclease III
MAGITTYLSTLTLNANGLNYPIKRHHLANWIKKENPTIYHLQEIHRIDRNKHRFRVKGWKKIYQPNGPQNQAGVAILISGKVDFIGQMRQRRTLHTNERDNTSKENNNYQPICTQCKCTKFHQPYTGGLKSTYRI